MANCFLLTEKEVIEKKKWYKNNLQFFDPQLCLEKTRAIGGKNIYDKWARDLWENSNISPRKPNHLNNLQKCFTSME